MAGFVLLLALPIAYFGFHQAEETQRETNAAVDAELRFAADAVSTRVEGFLIAYRRVVETMARDAQMEAKPLQSQEWMEKSVAAVDGNYNDLNGVLYLDPRGLVLAAIPKVGHAGKPMRGFDFSGREWFQEAKSGATSVADVMISNLRKSKTVAMATAVRGSDNQPVGYAVISVSFNVLSDAMIGLTSSLNDTAIAVLDQYGKVILHSDPVYREQIRDLSSVPLFRLPEQPSVVRTELNENGQRVRAVVRNLHQHGVRWRVVVMRSAASIEQRVEHVRRGWATATAFAVGSGLLFALLAFAFVGRPLGALARLATAIGQGDLTKRPPEPAWWFPREPAELFLAMGKMQQGLRNSLQLFESLRGSLDSARGNIAALLDERGGSFAAHGNNLTDVARFATELHQAATQVGQEAEQVLSVATRAEEAQAGGQAAFDSTLQQLQLVQTQFESLVNVTRTLEEQVARVALIRNNLEQLASRSNVLSINAAIEAMRAGESGRGFSIVAKSISELSETAQKYGEQMETILSEASKELRIASAQSSRGTEQISQGVAQLRSSGESLGRVAETVKESAAAARSVASSVSHQRDVAERMDQSMSTLRQVLDALVEKGARADEAAKQVSELSEGLASFLSQFRT